MADETNDTSKGTILIPERPITQVINGDSKFVEETESKLIEWKFCELGVDYYVVAVLGCQSSGKSTLLNLLFGTNFEVMDAKSGRQQTTKGVWMAMSGSEGQRILVFDVEGTDSRERGEDHGLVERKMSLFSLAIAEVLVINMWTHDVGRYEGANYSLLKVVFELNLLLFSSASGNSPDSTNTNKTLLFFVFRDHDPEEDASLENLQKAITVDMEKLWNEMPKQGIWAQSRVQDFFDFQYTSLPHKLLKKDFASGISKLQGRFLEPEHPDYIMSKSYKTSIPADGLATYARNVWETIEQEKDLDLPSQKQMLALFRCDELIKEALEEFVDATKEWKDTVDCGKKVESFGSEGSELLAESEAKYAKITIRYDKKIVNEKRATLRGIFSSHLEQIFRVQVGIIIEECQKIFQDFITSYLPADGPAPNFGNMCMMVSNNTRQHFLSNVRDCQVQELGWSVERESKIVQSYVEDHLVKIRDSQIEIQTKILVRANRLSMTKNLTTLVEPSVILKENEIPNRGSNGDSSSNGVVDEDGNSNDVSNRWWSKVGSTFENMSTASLQKYENMLQNDYSINSEETEVYLNKLKITLETQLRDLVAERALNVDVLMLTIFKQGFELDDEGAPRRWLPGDNVKALWVHSKRKAEQLVDIFSLFRLSPTLNTVHYFTMGNNGAVPVDSVPEVDESVVLLSPMEGARLLSKFRDHTMAPYHSALNEQERAEERGNLPVWMYVLLILLGANEFIWVLNMVLFNPIMLVFLCMLLGMVFALWKLQLLGVVWGMVLPMLQQVLSVANLKAKDFYSNVRNGNLHDTGSGNGRSNGNKVTTQRKGLLKKKTM